jgi:hypothetical protein
VLEALSEGEEEKPMGTYPKEIARQRVTEGRDNESCDSGGDDLTWPERSTEELKIEVQKELGRMIPRADSLKRESKVLLDRLKHLEKGCDDLFSVLLRGSRERNTVLVIKRSMEHAKRRSEGMKKNAEFCQAELEGFALRVGDTRDRLLVVRAELENLDRILIEAWRGSKGVREKLNHYLKEVDKVMSTVSRGGVGLVGASFAKTRPLARAPSC